MRGALLGQLVSLGARGARHSRAGARACAQEVVQALHAFWWMLSYAILCSANRQRWLRRLKEFPLPPPAHAERSPTAGSCQQVDEPQSWRWRRVPPFRGEGLTGGFFRGSCFVDGRWPRRLTWAVMAMPPKAGTAAPGDGRPGDRTHRRLGITGVLCRRGRCTRGDLNDSFLHPMGCLVRRAGTGPEQVL